MKTPLPLIVAVLTTGPAWASENRQLDAHEHGVGELNIAIDGTTLAMELNAPGADIVGFEYTADSAEDRAAIDTALAVLARPLELFVVPAAADCTLTQAKAELEGDDHDDHGDHDEHGDEDHAEHNDHGDEGAAQHTEFHAEYMLTCANPGGLSDIRLAYFDVFENARELDVQIVTSAGALAVEVERDSPVLDLRGKF